MAETEGVIKYHVDHLKKDIEQTISLSEINAWRTVLFKLQLIGQQQDRYEGYGYGNISQRLRLASDKTTPFIISGTQTGGIQSLSRQHYCQVLEADPSKNSLKSIGLTPPSSEALTHASVYQQDHKIQAVIHVHCPTIWNNTLQLKLPHTTAEVAYGTPEMAKEVARLIQTKQSKQENIFSMLGHEDGIIAFSDSMEKAALLLIKYYSFAIALEQTI